MIHNQGRVLDTDINRLIQVENENAGLRPLVMSLENENRNLENENAGLKAFVSNLEDEFERDRKHMQRDLHLLDGLQRSKEHLQRQIEDMKRDPRPRMLEDKLADLAAVLNEGKNIHDMEQRKFKQALRQMEEEILVSRKAVNQKENETHRLKVDLKKEKESIQKAMQQLNAAQHEKRQMEMFQKRCQDQTQDITALTQKLHEVGTENQNLRHVATECGRLQNELRGHGDYAMKLEYNLHASEDEIARLSNQARNTELEAKRYKDNQHYFMAERKKVESTVEKLQSDLSSTKAQNTGLLRDKKHLNSRMQVVEDNFKEANKKKEELADREVKVKLELGRLTNAIDSKMEEHKLKLRDEQIKSDSFSEKSMALEEEVVKLREIVNTTSMINTEVMMDTVKMQKIIRNNDIEKEKIVKEKYNLEEKLHEAEIGRKQSIVNLSELQRKISDLELGCSSFEAEKSLIIAEQEYLSREVDALTEELDKTKAKIPEVKTKMTTAIRKEKEVVAKLDRATLDMKRMEEFVQRSDERQTKMEQHTKLLREEKEVALKETEDLKDALGLLKDQIDSMEMQRDVMRGNSGPSYCELRKETLQLREEKEENKKVIAQLKLQEQEHETKLQENKVLKSELSSLKHHVIAMDTQVKSIDGEASNVESELRDKVQKLLQGKEHHDSELAIEGKRLEEEKQNVKQENERLRFQLNSLEDQIVSMGLDFKTANEVTFLAESALRDETLKLREERHRQENMVDTLKKQLETYKLDKEALTEVESYQDTSENRTVVEKLQKEAVTMMKDLTNSPNENEEIRALVAQADPRSILSEESVMEEIEILVAEEKNILLSQSLKDKDILFQEVANELQEKYNLIGEKKDAEIARLVEEKEEVTLELQERCDYIKEGTDAKIAKLVEEKDSLAKEVARLEADVARFASTDVLKLKNVRERRKKMVAENLTTYENVPRGEPDIAFEHGNAEKRSADVSTVSDLSLGTKSFSYQTVNTPFGKSKDLKKILEHDNITCQTLSQSSKSFVSETSVKDSKEALKYDNLVHLVSSESVTSLMFDTAVIFPDKDKQNDESTAADNSQNNVTTSVDIGELEAHFIAGDKKNVSDKNSDEMNPTDITKLEARFVAGKKSDEPNPWQQSDFSQESYSDHKDNEIDLDDGMSAVSGMTIITTFTSLTESEKKSKESNSIAKWTSKYNPLSRSFSTMASDRAVTRLGKTESRDAESSFFLRRQEVAQRNSTTIGERDAPEDADTYTPPPSVKVIVKEPTVQKVAKSPISTARSII
uniref:Uncharacterized protein n=1 Tax=Chaetoceros debilis TaxID=122233 RepID=A0A7S3VF67_9STRA|mmetsp:Transcript_28010/g.42928  ORF Transcript_28010/g.42928 Transcript_28010/m.42928 type:complete len:1279 (-) Transcript_28010:110-3946(-)|eukprot:CAMPEP_0194086904 /NCGR_PEP_ID=MMETSP0149-20130528/22928_1 /TAXON_ID=122233 /ORGANISM="Chaetoceros debilis, Strain MM31A-1" /LENGTH=1278 /DNA_ID=CAMNT_0038770115 /DNA_START=56 /DNA_END=3892 /DNA_ORIENTATION=+